jgi:adenylate kinase
LKVHDNTPEEIISSIVKTEIQNPATKHKGFILDGFPRNDSQLSICTAMKINPHLVIILDDESETLMENFKKLHVDEDYGIHYDE